MHVVSAFIADAELPPGVEPADGPFNHPPITPESGLRLDSSPGDSVNSWTGINSLPKGPASHQARAYPARVRGITDPDTHARASLSRVPGDPGNWFHRGAGSLPPMPCLTKSGTRVVPPPASH